MAHDVITPRVVEHLHSGLIVRVVEDGGAIRVSVGGEIDLGCADMLHQVLAGCLSTAPHGIDVDLTGVGFCDSSGLNALLRAREHARAVGVRLTVGAVSAPVARVLGHSHCSDTFPEAVVSVPVGRGHRRHSARFGDAADDGTGPTRRWPKEAGQQPRALRLHMEAVLARRLGMAGLPARPDLVSRPETVLRPDPPRFLG